MIVLWVFFAAVFALYGFFEFFFYFFQSMMISTFNRPKHSLSHKHNWHWNMCDWFSFLHYTHTHTHISIEMKYFFFARNNNNNKRKKIHQQRSNGLYIWCNFYYDVIFKNKTRKRKRNFLQNNPISYTQTHTINLNCCFVCVWNRCSRSKTHTYKMSMMQMKKNPERN